MSTNRHALIRYRTIDQCLRDRENTYRLKDLIEACSQAISDYSGKPTEVKRRTLLYDLKFMKDDKSGFSAPIENDRTDGYYYSDPHFSIFFNPLKQSDLETLKSTLMDLQRISGKKGFEDLDSVITRLEATYNIRHSRNERPTVQFEHSTNIDGQKHVSTIKKYIADKQPLQIQYEPFDEPEYTRYISPYLLKEYNNRWFLIGYEYDSDWEMTVLALDRINKVGVSVRDFYMHPDFDPDTYHNDIIGVTLPSNGQRVRVEIKAYGKARHYLNTKPLHHSQQLEKMGNKAARFSLDVIPNPELETKILSYCDNIEVIAPTELRQRIASRLNASSDRYTEKKSKKKKKKGKKKRK
jgi:predicted DNA-binding transcriptional regulator YafY